MIGVSVRRLQRMVMALLLSMTGANSDELPLDWFDASALLSSSHSNEVCIVSSAAAQKPQLSIDSLGVPAHYTVTEEFAAFEDFESWPHTWPPAPVPSFTTNDWVATDVNIGFYDSSCLALINGPGLDDGLFTNSTIRTPLLSNGAGTLAFSGSVFSASGIEFTVEVSEDASTWTTAYTGTVSGPSGVFSDYNVELGIYDPVYVRLRKSETTGIAQWLLVDDVFVSYPPTTVEVSDLAAAPPYPTTGDPVHVSCQVSSIDAGSPASITRTELFYRQEGEASWSGPIGMAPSGDRFVTESPIPRCPISGATVECYVAVHFDGYHYSTSPSPVVFPAPDAPYTYGVRSYASDFSLIRLGDAAGPEMTLVGDYKWRGALQLAPAQTQVVFSVTGYAAQLPGGDVIWGVDGTADTTGPIPQVGSLMPGGVPLGVAVANSGDVLLVEIDEQSLQYTVRHAHLQDFEGWRTSDLGLFDETVDDPLTSPVAAAEFTSPASWPESVSSTNSDPVLPDAWPAAASLPYTNDFLSGLQVSDGSLWAIGDSVAITQLVGLAYLFDDTPGDGRLQTRPDQPIAGGVGWVQFDARATDNLGPLDPDYSVYNDSDRVTPHNGIMVEAQFYTSELPTNSVPEGMPWVRSIGHSAASMIVRMVDEQNYYELSRSQLYDEVDERETTELSLYCVKGGVRRIVWRRTTPGPYTVVPATYRVVLDNGSGDKLYFSVFQDGVRLVNGFTPSQDLCLPAAGGRIGFRGTDAGVSVDHVTAGKAEIMGFTYWPSISAYTNQTWDGWETAWSTSGYTLSLRPYDLTGVEDMSYVKSPLMPNGVGTVSLRVWQGTGTHATALLQYSTTGGSSPSEWVTFEVIETTPSSSARSVNADIAISNVYFRIACSNSTGDPSAQLRVDDILLLPHPDLAFQEDFAGSPTNWIAPDAGWTTTNGVLSKPCYNGQPLGIEAQFLPLARAADAELEGAWETVGDIPALTHGSYRTYRVGVGRADDGFLRLRHTTGSGHLVLDNLTFTDQWRGHSWVTTNGWELHQGFASRELDGNTGVVSLLPARATNGVSYLQTPVVQGAGTLFVDVEPAAGEPVTMYAWMRQGQTNAWQCIATSAQASTGWRAFAVSTPAVTPVQFRISCSASNIAGGIHINRVVLGQPVPPLAEVWSGHNMRVASQEGEGIDRYGELNKSPTNETTAPFLDAPPFIRSPRLGSGLGLVAFEHGSGDGETYTLHIRGATEQGAPEPEWEMLDVVYGPPAAGTALYQREFLRPDLHAWRVDQVIPSMGCAQIDNISLGEPLISALSVRGIHTVPIQPLTLDAPHVRCEAYSFVLAPSNLVLNAHWRSGEAEWGSLTGGQSIPMRERSNTVGSIWYETETPIPALPADTVVQYWITATFDGHNESVGGPLAFADFRTPSHYAPVDLCQKHGGCVPHYFSYSCPPGSVWINEMNAAPASAVSQDAVGQFVELCGPGGAGIGGWSLQSMNTNFALVDSVQLPRGTVLGGSSTGFGFVVWGDLSSVSNVTVDSSTEWPSAGGFRLLRSMGAEEQAICYSSDPGREAGRAMTNSADYGFVYVGIDDTILLGNNGLAMVGTGTSAEQMAWQMHHEEWTPGTANAGQLLTGTPAARLPYHVGIAAVSLTESHITLSVAPPAPGEVLIPMFNSNELNTGAWRPATGVVSTPAGDRMGLTCDRPDNVPACFFKVVSRRVD